MEREPTHSTQTSPRAEAPWFRRPEFFYSGTLFVVAVAAVTAAIGASGGVLRGHHPGLAFFFILYGLFTISAGYEQPGVGYVSFDRVSQIASILILGPVDAAWVNGLASLIFPLSRLRNGTPIGRVVTASLNNAGLMTLLVLCCGSLYRFAGGAVPLFGLDLRSIILLPMLILSMQVVNEVLMGIFLRLRDQRATWNIHPFTFALESGSGVTAVLFAIVWNRMEPAVIVLLLATLSAGMLALKQFARLRLHLETLVDERTSVLQAKTAELDELVARDQLTGLYNRRQADAVLARSMEEFHRYGRGFSIALIDLDHFKRINDEQSHEVGDHVLKRVARIFSERCRESDMVARYGGEEFLICFPEADAPAVARICEELRIAVATTDWSVVAPGIRVSISTGIAEMRPGFDRSALLRAADRKLYEAKNGGRNLVVA